MRFKLWKLILWIVLILVLFYPSFFKVRQLKLKDDALSQKMRKIEQENAKLKEEIRLLKSDPVYIEQIAREDLNMAKKNEIILKVVDSEKKDDGRN